LRVPPRLTAPQRRRGRRRGKSDAIDALATARAALQGPGLDPPSAGEGRLGDSARAERARRSPRRPGRGASPLPAAAALAPARARPAAAGAARRARQLALSRPRGAAAVL